MSYLFSLVPGIVLLLLLAVFLVLLPVAIVFNFRAGMKYRAVLAQRLAALRLGRMLGALGIDIDAYLARERVVDIHRQMQRCAECTSVSRCDTEYADGAVSPDNIAYCNNAQDLAELTRHEPAGESNRSS